MKLPGGRWLPLLAAVAVATFVFALAASYLDAVGKQGVEVDLFEIWGGTAVVAAVFAVATFVMVALPDRDRRRALKLKEDLQAKELHVQAALASAPVMLFATDRDGHLTLAAGAALVDFDVKEGAGEGDPLGFTQEGSLWSANIQKALVGEEISDLIEYKDRTFETSYRPVRDSGGQIIGMVGVATDVTERRTVELEDRKAAEQTAELERLREINAMKTNLLNTAAHELNTPLTPLRLQIHLLKSGSLGDLSERQQRAAAILQRSVERLGSLVDDILDVARLQSDRLKMDLRPTSVRGLLEDVVDSFVEPAQQVGIKMVVEPGEDAVVEADAGRLTQVLTNLASNAIKFTPEGGTIRFALQVDGDKVQVRCTDSGHGLVKAQIERLFQPFSQVHDPMTVTARGTGLGLYISKGIVEGHGGSIGVSSAGHGQGSTFAFTLPLAPAGTKAEPVEPLIPPPQNVGSAPRQAPRQSALAKRIRELI